MSSTALSMDPTTLPSADAPLMTFLLLTLLFTKPRAASFRSDTLFSGERSTWRLPRK